MSQSRQEELVIAGNGPAGISAAHQIRDQDPLIISPDVPPEPSVCGGVLTEPAVRYLRSEDILEPLLAQGGRELQSLGVFHDGVRILTDELSNSEMVCIHRERIDQHLWSILNMTEIRHRHGYIVEVDVGKNEITLQLRHGPTIRTRGLIDATGHRRLTQMRGENQSTPDLASLEWTVTKQDTMEPELSLLLGDRMYAGLAPLPNNKLTVSAVVDQPLLQSTSRVFVWNQIRQNVSDDLRRVLPRNLDTTPKVKAGFWNDNTRDTVRSRIVSVGDAAGFTMPLSGEGIAMALIEGNVAGKILQNVMNSETKPFPLTRTVQKRLTEQLILPFRDQLPRWNLTHWIGMNGPNVSSLSSLSPILGTLLFKMLKPAYPLREI